MRYHAGFLRQNETFTLCCISCRKIYLLNLFCYQNCCTNSKEIVAQNRVFIQDFSFSTQNNICGTLSAVCFVLNCHGRKLFYGWNISIPKIVSRQPLCFVYTFKRVETTQFFIKSFHCQNQYVMYDMCRSFKSVKSFLAIHCVQRYFPVCKKFSHLIKIVQEVFCTPHWVHRSFCYTDW